MLIFLDTETTGTAADDRLCQLAYKNSEGLVVNELFNPGKPISIEAMAVHHITNEMVEGKPVFKGSPVCRQLEDLLSDHNNTIVAHNAKFDLDMLRKEGIQPGRSICTYKLIRYLDGEGAIPQYNLQYLRYYLKLDIEAVPHSALGDILVLEGLFNWIASRWKADGSDPVESMVHVSSAPVLIARMPFGKHKGLKMNQVPVSYLNWLLSADIDEDLAYTVRCHLKRT